ncbi:alpha/beta fold hydrolase [Streptomyces sp. NPDC003077]|uniref:thioesterase II family protein n=1 Tax=Streptomyces sp. NPDC003077 TaxID=3154443 RepID=UPI0033BE29C5
MPDTGAPRVRLVCFPHAGGSAAGYRAWAAALAPAVEVVPAELPGRDGRVRETPLRDMDALAADAADRLVGREGRHPPAYAFFGHSMGAVLAYETARELRRRARVPVLLVASGSDPPHRVAEASRDRHLLPEPEFLREVLRLGGTSAHVLAEPELLRVLLPRLRADYAAAETYAHRDGEPLACPVTVYAGAADPTVRPELLADWARIRATPGEPVVVRRFPGGHFYLDDARPYVLRAIAKDVHTALHTAALRAPDRKETP